LAAIPGGPAAGQSGRLTILIRHARGLCCDMDFLTTPRSWSRYVALGDSLTAGRGDFGPDGRPVGWARRLAALLTDRTGVSCALTNLAVDGATVGRVLADQLPHLNEVRPDLVSATVGMNDIRDPGFKPGDFAVGVGRLFDALAQTGATVLTCTLPDIADVVPLPPEYVTTAHRRLRQAGDIIREAAAVRGAVCLDTWAMKEVAARPDLFTADRLHPNATGHRMLAAVFADLLVPAQSAA
jgi:lysophospholipase L1-like esterase